jgi:hypothetical protein
MEMASFTGVYKNLILHYFILLRIQIFNALTCSVFNAKSNE